MFESLAPLTALTEDTVFVIALVFARVGATAALLPGFGEQSIPMRVRLLIAVAFTLITWPMIAPLAAQVSATAVQFAVLIALEALIGTALGLVIRLLVMALQLAGSMAAQATSLSQIMGAGATPDPLPAIGNILVIGGVALALVSGLHIKAAEAIVLSYRVLPIGLVPAAPDLAMWGLGHAARAFALAFMLATPFVIASFAYNLMLGFINRAMPQLMVAFIGAPAITAGGILILAIASPLILTVWSDRLDQVLANPFAGR